MANSYYDPADLRKFGKITEWNEELGNKFFDYYGKVFEEGALTAREKSLIALAVSHVVKCPYCIDSYTKDGLQRGHYQRRNDGGCPCWGCNRKWSHPSTWCSNDEQV